jgi:hypothetical protein
MFKLTPNPTFKASVPLSVPGMAQPMDVVIEFRHKGATAIQKWMASAPDRQDVELLDEVIAGWSGVMDEGGAPVPYSLGNLAILLENYPAAKWELLAAYKAELTEAKRKN